MSLHRMQKTKGFPSDQGWDSRGVEKMADAQRSVARTRKLLRIGHLQATDSHPLQSSA